MIYNEREIRDEQVMQVGRQMMIAARTAPKAKGVDIIECLLVAGQELEILAQTMESIGKTNGFPFFLRDAGNIRQAVCVLLIGTRRQALGLNCGYCGAPTCAERQPEVPCTFNSVDVGIALGAACALAADHRVDCRVMYSAGKAALQLQWMPSCHTLLAIPLSASSKNPFFDRIPPTPPQS